MGSWKQSFRDRGQVYRWIHQKTVSVNLGKKDQNSMSFHHTTEKKSTLLKIWIIYFWNFLLRIFLNLSLHIGWLWATQTVKNEITEWPVVFVWNSTLRLVFLYVILCVYHWYFFLETRFFLPPSLHLLSSHSSPPSYIETGFGCCRG